MTFSEIKKPRNIIMVVLLIVLLIFPRYTYIAQETIYYMVVGFIIIPLVFLRIAKGDMLDRRAYNKWKKRREKGYLFNLIMESIKTILLILLIVMGNQFIVYGRTPNFLLSEISGGVILKLMIFIIIIGFLGGYFSWHEKDKKLN